MINCSYIMLNAAIVNKYCPDGTNNSNGHLENKESDEEFAEVPTLFEDKNDDIMRNVLLTKDDRV